MQQTTLNFIYFLAAIGALWFIIFIAKLIWSLIKLILPAKNYQQRYGQPSWAVVTGGSDGLGLGFCEQLAQLGFNICMIARNKQKMDKALDALKSLYEDRRPIKTKSIVADFSNCQNDGFFHNIAQQLQGLDISILVNNVGISNIGYLHELPDKRILNQININIVSMTLMSHMLIPNMLKRPQRSAILNISSFSAQHPIPYIATYSASKAYGNFFSQCIEMEYEHKIDVLSVRPLYVESNMSKKKSSFTVASRNQCAQSSLGHLGIDYETNAYFPHRIIASLVGIMPKPMVRCMSQSSSRQIMEKEKEQNDIKT